MPSSFAEASLLARKAQEKRDRSFLHSSSAMIILDDLPRPASLSGSSCSEISDADHPTPASLELTMDPVDTRAEAELSISILNMQLDTHSVQENDSFSSQPDSNFNMGALRFIELLESALENRASEEQAVQFEELVVQMLDLSVDNKLSTPYDISGVLNSKGWNAGQVASVWRVSTEPVVGPAWSFDVLRSLGGRDVSSKIWNNLKENSLTGNPKRSLDVEQDLDCQKRARLDTCTMDKSNATPDIKGTIMLGSKAAQQRGMRGGSRSDSQSTPCFATPEMPAKSRKRRSRTSHLVASPRITQWFKNIGVSPVDQAAPLPTASNAPAAPEPTSKKILYPSPTAPVHASSAPAAPEPVPKKILTPEPPAPASSPAENSDSRRPPASKKRMRRMKKQSTSKEERPHSSCSRSISFPVPTVPSPAAPEPSVHAKKTSKDLPVPDVVGSSQVSSKNCPAESKPNQQKRGYGSPVQDVMTASKEKKPATQ